MRGPQPPLIRLSAAEHEGLETLVRAHTTPQQVVLRAQIVRAAACGWNNAQIARQLAVDVLTVRLWRTRWLGLQTVSLKDLSVAERLEDAPRSGRPAVITAAQVCAIVALACDAPRTRGRPISQWTGREIADEIVAQGILSTISPRHAARVLKRGACNRT